MNSSLIPQSWAKSGGSFAAQRAEDILNKMELEMIQNGESLLATPYSQRSSQGNNQGQQQTSFPTPTTISYNFVMDAWAKSESKLSARKVEDTFLRLLSLYNKGYHRNIKPNLYSYTILMRAITTTASRCPKYISKNDSKGNNKKLVNAAQKVEALLEQLVDTYQKSGDLDLKPNTATFNIVIDAWSKCSQKGSAQKAEQILNRLESGSDGLQVFPDTISYTSVISAWASSGERSSGYKAERILNRMVSFNEKNLNANADPNMVTYSAAINAWAKSKARGSGTKAQALLHRLEGHGYKPNLTTFNSLISAWAWSGQKDSIGQIEALLERYVYNSSNECFKLNHYSSIEPDAITWNTVLHAYSRSRAESSIEKANTIVHSMENQYKKGNTKSKPNVITYTTLMRVYGNTSSSEKIFQVEQIFSRLLNLYEAGDKSMKPSIQSYSVLLKACANTQGTSIKKEKALSIALKTFQKLDESEYIRPNHFIYSIMIDLFSNLISDDKVRTQHISTFFGRCCKEGYLNTTVLKSLHRSVDRETWKGLTGIPSPSNISDSSLGILPSKWSSRTKQNR